MSTRRFKFRVSAVIVILAASALCPPESWAGTGFQPVNPDELKMTSEPLAPGAPAVILYRQVDRDDSSGGRIHEDNYMRIKILTEDGRKYADIEIPFLKNFDDVAHLEARTIKPDGSIVNLTARFLKSLFSRPAG